MIKIEKITKHIVFHSPFLNPDRFNHIHIAKGNINPFPSEGQFFTYLAHVSFSMQFIFGHQIQITNAIKVCNCSDIPEDERWPNNGYFAKGSLSKCGAHDHNSSILTPKNIWNLNHGWLYDGILTITGTPVETIEEENKQCQHEFIPLFTTVCCKYCGIEK